MRTQVHVRAGLLALVATLLISCTWQVPENVRFRGSPQVAIPLGSALFDFDDIVNVGELTTGFEGELGTGTGFTSVSTTDTTPVTLAAIFEVDTPIGWDGTAFPFTIGEFDLTGVFGPFPEGVDFVEVPLEVAVTTIADPSGPINLDVDLVAQYTAAEHDPFATIAIADGSPDQFMIEEVINARPADLELQFTVAVTSGNADDINSITITLSLPFAFELEDPEADIALDLSDDANPEDKPFEFDDDIFGRDPADPDEDLNDFIDSLRGSNAEIVMELNNTVGLTPIVRLNSAVGSAVGEGVEIVKTPTPPQTGLFTFVAEMTATEFNKMVDSNPFYSKLDFLLPPTFQLNDGGELRVISGYLRAQASMDYTFTFDQEDE